MVSHTFLPLLLLWPLSRVLTSLFCCGSCGYFVVVSVLSLSILPYMNLLRFNLNAHPKFLIHTVLRDNHLWLDNAAI